MEVAKQEVNGKPLPQRQQNQKQGGGGPGNQNQGGGPQNQQGGNKQNQNQNQNQRNQNKNRGGGGGGGGQNRFGNRNQQQQGGGNRQNNQDGNAGDGNNQQQHQQRQGGGGGGGGQGNRGGNRNRNQGGDGDQGFDRRRSGPGEQYFINEKLRMLQGPMMDIPPIESATEEIKFSGRNRLYIGNLTNDATEEELVELFKPYGDINEVFMNKEKNYAFVRVDYFANAEKAKRELEGTSRKNRILRVRFAPNATAIRVKNLTPDVSNELLFKAFEVFGPLERAMVQVDERGKSTGEGIVEYKTKPGAMTAQRYCTERCYFLNSSLRPVIVEPYSYQDNNADGLPEKSLNKKIPEFQKLRQHGPHFADMNSFEHEYGQRWKHMHDLFKQKAEALKREMIMEEEKLEAQMEYARYEHETEQLREQLRMREQDSDRQKAEWEMKERMAQEGKVRNEQQMKHKVEEMQGLIKRSDDELHRRQQENNVFMQNQQMNDDDNRQSNMGGGGGGGGGSFGGMEIRDYEHGQNRQSRFNNDDGQQNQQGGGGGGQQRQGNAFGGGGGNRNWMNNNNDRRNNDEFQSKRRRF